MFTFHEKFSADEFETQYNLRMGRQGYEVTVIPDWMTRSECARETPDCQLDIRYGDGGKQRLDVFSASKADAVTLVYFHGRYWQRGDKSIYSFLARPFVEAGVNIIVVGYNLCPEVTITRISDEAREAMAYIDRHAATLKIDPSRISVMGHSAGGHITEMMMGTHWPEFASDLPESLVKSGIPVSPISYLEPVRLTLRAQR